MEFQDTWDRNSMFWALFVGAVILFQIYDWWSHQYFQRLGIPVVPYYPIVGNGIQWLIGGTKFYEECIEKYGKVVGLYRFQTPILCVTDADLLEKIQVSHFSKFMNHWTIPGAGWPLKCTMLYMKGQRWREVRAISSPSFTISKMRQIIDIFNDCCDPLLNNFETAVTEKNPVDCKRVFGGFIVQTMVAISFGLDVKCQDDLDHPFLTKVLSAFQPSILTALPVIFPILGPLFNFLGVNIFPNASIEFFKKVVEDSSNDRNRIHQGRGQGPNQYLDMLQLYMMSSEIPGAVTHDEELPPGDPIKKTKKLSYDEFLAHVVLFLVGVHEAPIIFLTCTAYQLAMNPDVQEKCIREIDTNLPIGADVTYDSLLKITYVETVVMETLRINPPSILADRVCNESVTFGKYTIEEGQTICIPYYSIQHDKDYWPNPGTFDPERFNADNKDSIDPVTFTTFGVGPRSCIATRMMVTLCKLMLVHVLRKYRFQKGPETPVPLEFGKVVFLEPKNVFVRVSRRGED